MNKIKSFDQLMEGVHNPQNKAQEIFKNNLLEMGDKETNIENVSDLLLNVIKSYIECYGEIKDEISEDLKRWIMFFMVNDLEVKEELATGDFDLEIIFEQYKSLSDEERKIYNNSLEIDPEILAGYLLEIGVGIGTITRVTNLELENVVDLYDRSNKKISLVKHSAM